MSKRVIQKTAEATGNLIGNKIGYKIISAPTLPSKTGNVEFEKKKQRKNENENRKSNRKKLITRTKIQ